MKSSFTLTYAQNSNNFGENYAENVPGSSGFDDSTYKFQGYLIYQLADATVTAQELSDASRARLLYQCDIKDDIVDIYNYEPLTANGQTIYSPVLKVSGSNEGIERSLQVTTDLFAIGDNKLVNHKDYYYMALAYGYNNFYPYVLGDTSSVVPQYEPYILGQRNIKQYTCTPHRSNPWNVGGTELNAIYGQGLRSQELKVKEMVVMLLRLPKQVKRKSSIVSQAMLMISRTKAIKHLLGFA